MIERYMIFASSISNIYKTIQKLERREMERFGLKGPHAQYLLAVAGHPQGITAAQLAQYCDKDKAAISRALAELEQKGMLNRVSGYRATLTLTEQGKAVTDQIAKTVNSTMEQASFGMNQEKRVTFYHMLNEISDNLEIVCEEGVPTE